MKIILSSSFEYLSSPGFIPENIAVFISYLTIFLLFPLDVITDSQIPFHVFYLFPLILIALHSSRNDLVLGAVTFSISLQLIALLSSDNESLTIKIYLFLLIALSNSIFTVAARFARANTLEAERLSTIDPLTQLYNRRSLVVALDTEIVRQRRYGGCFSVALIDLDEFKVLNDSMGHQAGDRALMLVAEILRDHTRQSDTISRIGGDEFVILMPNTHAADCDTLCQILCHKIGTSMAAVSFPITASIGYTTVEQSAEISKDVLTIADKAMYEAKYNGKGCVVRGYSTTKTPEETPEEYMRMAEVSE